MAQELYELPEGWRWRSLSEVTEVSRKSILPKKDEVYNYIGLEHIEGGTGRLVDYGPIKGSGISSTKTAFRQGMVLYGKLRPYLNKVHVAKFEGIATTEIIPFACGNDIGAEYLAVYMRSGHFLDAVMANCSGARMPRATTKFFKNIAQIPVPPIDEQKRIVAKLDALFTHINAATTHLQETLELSKALFASASAELFNEKASWKTLKLSELIKRGWILSHLDGNHGSNYPRNIEFVDKGIPYISANCLKDGEVRMELSKYLTPERASRLKKGLAQNSDVLFAHNATVGPVAILRTSEKVVILSTSLTYYRCDPDFILPEYLAQYMRSVPFTSQYRSVMNQSTRNQVPITKQREFIHIVPPIDEQRRIAGQLDSLSECSRALEAETQDRLDQLTALKSSLLDAAFRGQL